MGSHPKAANLEQEEESFSYAVQLASSTVFSMALQTAVELGVFDVMAKAGEGAKLSAMDIAAEVGSENPEAAAMLDRILKLLASHSVLCCTAADETNLQRLYSMAPVSRFFALDADGVSLGPLLILLQDKVFLESWPQLKTAILKGGIPFDMVHGMNTFEYPRVDSRFNKLFQTALVHHSTLVIKKVLESYKGFENINTLVDVGGGFGTTLNLITSKYPRMKGINFDLPHVIQNALPYSGVEHVAGDMFEEVPKADAIFMKWILHDWSNEHCVKLLKNCYKATPEDGKVIIVDAIIPEIPNATAAVKSISQIDIFMMTQDPGGKERSQQDFLALANAAGFSGIRYDCFVRNFWVMEFFK